MDEEKAKSPLHPTEIQFEGKVQSMRLVSRRSPFLGQEPNDETEQKLSLNCKGTVQISFYGGQGTEKHLTRDYENQFDPEEVRDFLDLLGGYFQSGDRHISQAADGGSWDLLLVNEDGRKFAYSGVLTADELDERTGFSHRLRRFLELPDQLWLFDGGSTLDVIDKIDIDYDRKVNITDDFDGDGETIAAVYKEHIFLDRDSETLECIQTLNSGVKIRKFYQIPGAISEILDQFREEDFLQVKNGLPEDVCIDPNDQSRYVITVTFRHDECLVLTGTFDADGLPRDYPEVASAIFEFLNSVDGIESILPEHYGRKLRREGDLIFCYVDFEPEGKLYCYLTKDTLLRQSDFVIVPAGKENTLSVARIERIEYHKPENAPYPLDKIKTVLRKCTREDWTAYENQEDDAYDIG